MKEKSISLKTISMAFVLVAVLILSAFTLAGCGSTSLDTLAESYASLEAQVSRLQTDGVLSSDSGSQFGIETEYVVSYGTDVDKIVSSAVSSGSSSLVEYAELKTLYNAMLVIATNYSDSSAVYILSLKDEDITSDVQSAINDLNTSINECTEAYQTFATARETMVSHFELYGNTSNPSNETDLASLLQFKKSYGDLVEKIVDMAQCSANVVDASEIMDLLKSTGITADDWEDVQKYVSTKLLQVYSNVLLKEVSNKVTWSTTRDNGDKERISTLLENYKSAFETFEEKMIKTSTTITFSSDQQTQIHETLEDVLSALDAFCVEIEDFNTALTEFEISALAVEPYYNSLTAYLEDNALAEKHLQKLEQFVAYSLPNFVDYISTTLALS